MSGARWRSAAPAARRNARHANRLESAGCGGAALARTRLDHVFEGPVETFLDARDAGDLRFDCIVFGDVLEHLADPGTVLQRCRSILAPGGMVVASIPNVAHVAVRAMLLEGRWDYSDLGIMDRTHLRFFARSTLVELLSSAGLALRRLEYVELPAVLTGIRCAEETSKAVAPLCRDDTGLAFQYVVAARPADDAPAANRPYLLDGNFRVLCALPLPDSSLAAVRLRAPLTAWRSRHGGSSAGLLQISARDLQWADVVIVQRLADESVMNWSSRFGRAAYRSSSTSTTSARRPRSLPPSIPPQPRPSEQSPVRRRSDSEHRATAAGLRPTAGTCS
jgi:hypothetical protein